MKFFLLVALLSSPLVAQEALSPVDQQPAEEREVQQPDPQPFQQQQVVEFPAEEAIDRIVLFIDTFKYQNNTLELASKSEQSHQNLNTSRKSSSFVSTSTTIGVKSYHDGLILGFGLSSNLNANNKHKRANGGALFIGYELDAKWQFGGLLFIDNSEDRSEIRRRLQVDDETIDTTEISETSISRYSLGLWGKCAFNEHWRGQLSTYYATSASEQLVDNGQQNRSETEIRRKYLALTATFGSYVQISKRLTFTPQINLTYVLPLSYVQTSRASTASTAPPVEEKLDFDEQHNLSYSLTLAGFRYQL